MKKAAISIVILLILITGIYAVFQSNIGRNWIRNTILNTFTESGYQIEIQHVEGALPNRIELKGVEIRGEDVDIQAKSITLRPVLWRLLKRELAFKNVVAKDVSVAQATPFDFQGKFRLSKKRAYVKGNVDQLKIVLRYNLEQDEAYLSSQYGSLNVRARAKLTPDYELVHANVQFSDETVLRKLPFDAQGRVFGTAKITKDAKKYLADVSILVPNYQVKKVRHGSLKAEGNFVWENGSLIGGLTSKTATLKVDLKMLPSFLITGTTVLTVDNLQTLYIPDFYGTIEAKANWSETQGIQQIEIEPKFQDFSYEMITLSTLTGTVFIQDPFKNPTAKVNLTVDDGLWGDLKLNRLIVKGETTQTESPFRIEAKGSWHHPFEIQSIGDFEKPDQLEIKLLSGKIGEFPILLEDPVRLTITENVFLVPPTKISIAEGSLQFQLGRKGSNTEGSLAGYLLPLNLFSISPLDPSTSGAVNFEISLSEKQEKLSGQMGLTIEQMEPFSAIGNFEGTFSDDTLSLRGDLTSKDTPLLQLDVTLPIHLSIWPFDAHVLYARDALGSIAFDGKMEDFLDLIDLGPHHVSGDIVGHLSFRNTLARPLVSGSIKVENGAYENYYTGTILSQMSAQLLAEKNHLYLKNLKALDPDGGTFDASGQVHLLRKDQYPFRLDCDFTNFRFAQVDLVTALANGDLHIKGNAGSATLSGDVVVTDATLTIPSHIAKPLPELKVTYRNPIRQVPPNEPAYKPYPLFLDLKVSAPKVAIEGRGLQSEWRGDFDLGGTFTSIATQGKLELIQGQFSFSSRNFKLTEGALLFSGVEHQMPRINLAGTMETKGILITARLSGPLDDPQISLQSNPPLPMGSIMSYLLFGQDVSEIGGFQALQIATSLASLAGTGPDVMESTRKSLGVDRLRVVSDPAEGGDTVALEVGKYVAEGVLVSLTQGTEESSTNISVEIELKNNFIFEIQSDQRQEQGKFTLKWNLNY